MENKEFLKIPVWYPVLSAHTFITSFVKLRPEAVAALANGESNPEKGSPGAQVLQDLKLPMNNLPGNCFTSVDVCSPTDTERFRAKRGAVYSPASAWRFLAESEKVREAAARGEVEYICLKPFRRMNRTREFRLFIRNGELKAMSQYNLQRHFRRLEAVKEQYWKLAKKFVDSIAWLIPIDELVMDIYFTSDRQILIVDLNPWGEPTDPLMLRTWEHDWDGETGIVLMPTPTRISGEVQVSF